MRFIPLAILLFTTSAIAQPGTPSPNEQALGARLLREITESIQKDAMIITLQEQLKNAQERIRQLEIKAPAPEAEQK